MVVAGAGASGVEIASAYARLGTKVMLFEALDRVVPAEDADISKVVGRGLEQAEHRDPHRHQGRERRDRRRQGQLHLRRRDRRGRLVRDRRRPRARRRGPRARGGRRQARRPRHDRRRRRAAHVVKGVYAIGDLVRGPALAHKASDEGIIAVEDAAGMETHPIEYIDIPRATFCTPNVGSFGLTEEQAKRAGLRRRRRQGQLRRGRRRHRLRRPRRHDQDHRRQEVRRADRRPHRRRPRDRADPGARERQGARGRLPRGRAASSMATPRCPRPSWRPRARPTAG